MSLIIPANSAVGGGYAVDNSLRTNRGSSDYLNKTFSGSGNRRTFTISFWLKIAESSSNAPYIYGVSTSTTNAISIYYNSTGQLSMEAYTGAWSLRLHTSALLRDTSAWYHICYAIDTTQGTDTNRVKLYINGVQQTFSTSPTQVYPSQNLDLPCNQSGNSTTINCQSYYNAEFMSAYYSEFCMIDGTQNAVTDFGEFDADSGIWKPIDVSGLTFGTNGFYLDFKNSGALGADVSGNTNNFTVNNLTAIDQSTDTPTNNFATANPLLHGGTVATLSEGNLKLSTGASWKQGIPTIGVSSGKWYMEAKIGSMGQYYAGGVIDSYEINSWGASGSSYAGQTTLSIGYYNNGNKYIGDSASSYGASYTTGDIISTAIDLDAGTPTVTFYKNGASQGAVNLPTSSNSTGLWFFMPSLYSGTLELNFGSPPYAISSGNTDGNGYGNFEYAVPSGYLSLCTANLSESG